MLLSVLLISFYISVVMVKPINSVNRMISIYNPFESAQVRLPGYFLIDEINELGLSFNKMIGKIEDLLDEILVANMKNIEIEHGGRDAWVAAWRLWRGRARSENFAKPRNMYIAEKKLHRYSRSVRFAILFWEGFDDVQCEHGKAGVARNGV